MYQAPVGGKSNRKNQNAQARAHGEAMKKAEAESSAQVTTNNQTFQEMLGIVDSIIKDWSSESGKITGEVDLDQLEREICWAICFARLVQTLYNIGRPDVDHVEFSIEELILHIIPKTKNKDVERFGLCNLKIACKHIAKEGLLKLAVTGNKRQTPELDMEP